MGRSILTLILKNVEKKITKKKIWKISPKIPIFLFRLFGLKWRFGIVWLLIKIFRSVISQVLLIEQKIALESIFSTLNHNRIFCPFIFLLAQRFLPGKISDRRRHGSGVKNRSLSYSQSLTYNNNRAAAASLRYFLPLLSSQCLKIPKKCRIFRFSKKSLKWPKLPKLAKNDQNCQ